MEKKMKTKINKNHYKKNLTFSALLLCSSVLSANSCLGMEEEVKQKNSLKRTRENTEIIVSNFDTSLIDIENPRPTKRYRRENEGITVAAWLDKNFKENSTCFLVDNRVQEVLNFCSHSSLSITNLRKGLEDFVRKESSGLVYAKEKFLCTYDQNVDQVLNANPIRAYDREPGMFKDSYTPKSFCLTDSTKALLKNKIKEPYDQISLEIKIVEDLISYIKPTYTFSNNGILSIKGGLIGTSDIEEYLSLQGIGKDDKFKEIHVLSDTLLIDESLKCEGASFKFDVSHCKVLGDKSIDLSGKNGSDGTCGVNGNPGKNGGNFSLNCTISEGLDNLMIIAKGGNGGNGGQGAHGADADLKNLGTPHHTKAYNYSHKSGTENPQISCFQYYPQIMEWTLKGDEKFYQQDGIPGKPGGQGGKAGSGGLIFINKSQESLGLKGIDVTPGKIGNNGSNGKDGKSAEGVKLTNLQLSPWQMPVQDLVQDVLDKIMGVVSKGEQKFPHLNIWLEPPHYVDKKVGQTKK